MIRKKEDRFEKLSLNSIEINCRKCTRVILRGVPMSKRLKFVEASKSFYTSFYCEENVWRLCDSIRKEKEKLDDYYVVFISNKDRAVPMWFQKRCTDGSYVLWDYHVILAHKPTGDNNTFIYDLDSSFTTPCRAQFYIENVLRPDLLLKKCYTRNFRVITAEEFLCTFSSDRSHMLSNGSYIHPPPPFPAITIDGIANNLMQFVCMEEDDSIPGQVLNLQEFFKFCGLGSAYS